MPEAKAESGRAGKDGADGEAAVPAEELLRGQPSARRTHEGAAGGDDGSVLAGGAGLVPEQALQGQEEDEYEARKGRIEDRDVLRH